MKKHILILVLALFTGVISAFGQAFPGAPARQLVDCENGPLTPIAGVPYDYEAFFDPANGTALWFATTTTQFMTGGVVTTDREAIGGNYVADADAVTYDQSVSGVASPSGTNITWNSVGLAQVDETNPLFVVVHYQSPVCADNLKVYRINPINAFYVNILNFGGAYSVPDDQCYSLMQTATYDLIENCMVYHYGENVIPFEVVAANFTGSYTPSFRIEGLQGAQTAELFWGYDSNDYANNTATSIGAALGNGVHEGDPVSTTVTNTSEGVSIFVWLVIDNDTYEGLTNDDITLAVAGVNSANQNSVRWDNCELEVDLLAAIGSPIAPDYAIHTLNARPTVTPAGGLDFEESCD